MFTYSYRCLFDLSIDEKIKLIDKLVKYDKKIRIFTRCLIILKKCNNILEQKICLTTHPDEDLIAIYDNKVLSVNFDEFEGVFQ